MGAEESRPSVDELMDKIDNGDVEAIGELWGRLDRDGAGTLEGEEAQRCMTEIIEQLMEGWDSMEPERKDRLGKVMIPFFVKCRIDPNGDGVITKEEFERRIAGILNADG
uniref:EF-hand domain-containing protein n=1 Tax=Fibrocapsa japonica TaxID=94617 RepID=A0A7S2V5D9_9STRA|mmetsp:Transcript_7923/g.12114  ORF Transcript_7923/g.12114 Transcript_7923/m.12114 type:complete len:110 (+) Transcript_7923:146-475(+)|eukprot:CAMPEP_0113936608 /NCGR_PEP_ID=MMETSP1339-20121228/3483_1 /TAXON_ID=94617 /ORGANISM="Fibrocapsa japonica" /LENGTH=109 /DNA_ID=CAMNT_0000939139 /DNA_START=145 /DNA_END=474 /DNA_ORIENTATION=+ /assembly_acc=CAM_ASM_000762